MNRVYTLSRLLTLTLPLAALAGSSSAAPPHQAKMSQVQRAQQAQIRRAMELQRRRQAQLLTHLTAAGRVLDTEGKPAPNVTVSIHWMTSQNKEKAFTLMTDAEGRFEKTLDVNSPSRTLTVSAVVPGKNIAWKRFVLSDKPLPNIDLRFRQSVSVSGFLIDSDGKPLANQTLHLKRIGNPGGNGNGTVVFASNEIFQQQMAMGSAIREMILPSELTEKLFQVRTDDAGRFTFAGLPPKSTVEIATETPWLLSLGSMLPITIAARDYHAGSLVAVHPGSASVRITDPLTGKPVANTVVNLTLTGSDAATLTMLNSSFHRELTPPTKTDANGIAKFESLLPGNYYAFTDNTFEQFKVEAGKPAPTIAFALRQDALAGRILDAQGKPVSGVEVKMNAIMRADDEMSKLSPVVRFGEFGWENRPVATTDAQGRFRLPKTAWACGQLTVRATQGNARAEWIGSPKTLKGELTLTMKPNALITVTGRLIDPKRHVLTNAQFQSIHWTGAPRSFWVSNARTAQVDENGRFTLTGLERGESFSLITGTRFNGFVSGNGQRSGGKNVPFESPRFATQTQGRQQDLGDVMVHPLDDPGDLDDVYGFGGQPSVAQFPGLLPTPSDAAVREAKETLARYRSLLRAGDIPKAYELTSRLTPGWSEDYKTYLQNAALRDSREDAAASEADAVAVRYVPCTSAAALITGRVGMFSFGASPDFSSIHTELNRGTEWVFLIPRHGETNMTVGILRKEEGKWRVVNASTSLLGGGTMQMGAIQFAAQFDPIDANTPQSALKAGDIEAARRTAALYLHEWAAGRSTALRSLTSPLTGFANLKPDEFKHAFQRRTDEGICPLTPEEQPKLEAVTGLSLWEQQWMTVLSTANQAQNPMRMMIFNGGRMPQPEMPEGRFPADYVKRGDIALFQYTAQGRGYLISVVRHKNKWSVLEPAFVRSEAAPRDIALR